MPVLPFGRLSARLRGALLHDRRRKGVRAKAQRRRKGAKSLGDVETFARESVERTLPVHAKQVLTYLRLMDLPLGLLMNFGEETFKTGVKRIANNLCAFPSP
jgi:PD-(D/E)XK nuclease superfamily